jgi:hypothetical protein
MDSLKNILKCNKNKNEGRKWHPECEINQDLERNKQSG